jgi:hypothetical protein
MKIRLWYPLLLLSLGLVYIAVAAINRHYAWAWGREWLAPTLMLAVFAAILAGGFLPRQTVTRKN